jgi:hypothetical protein
MTATRQRQTRQNTRRRRGDDGPGSRRSVGGGGQITVRATVWTPKWCCDMCRHRAWEISRAAAGVALAVRLVDRAIEVELPATVIKRVEVPVTPKGTTWTAAWATHQESTNLVMSNALAR